MGQFFKYIYIVERLLTKWI